MASSSDLKKLAADPAAFQSSVFVPTGTGPRRLGDVMAAFQRKRFEAVNPSLLAVSRQQPPPIPRIWDERTKGGSKDTDWSVNLLWLLAFSRRPLRIQVGAYDAQQADEIRLIVRDILRIDAPVNAFLRQVIKVKTNEITNSRTGAIVEILTSDKLGSHGARPDVVILDELTHQASKEFASTLLDNADKMPSSFVVIVTNAGHDPSWQLNWKRLFQADPERWRILEYKGKPPWLGPDAWKEAERRNSPGRFARLFKGIWGSDTSTALDAADVDACVTMAGPMAGQERGWVFTLGLDIGLRKHATGLVVLGRHVGYRSEIEIEPELSDRQKMLCEAGLIEMPEPTYESECEEGTGRLRLAYAKAWKPRPGKKVSLEAVKAAIIRLDSKFRLAAVAVDPAQGEHLIELLEKENVPAVRYVQSVPSLQDQCVAMVEAFQQRTIDLYDDPDLIADLKALQTKESGMRIRLVSPEKEGEEAGTGHGDLASAMAFAMISSKDPKSVFAPQGLRSIICE